MQIGTAGLNIAASGCGTALLWAHALLSSMAADDALGWFGLDALPDSIRLVRYDARGHGNSDRAHSPSDFEWASLGADMLAVAQVMDAGKFIAGGMSMGCASALHAAIQAPARIRGLVLAMPPMLWEERAAQRQLYQRIAERGNDTDPRALAKLMGRDMARTLPPWLRQPGHAASMALGARAVAPGALASMFGGAARSDLPPRAALAVLADIPALILGWSGDRTHPEASAHELHRLLPSSELHIAHCLDDFTTFPTRIKAFAERVA